MEHFYFRNGILVNKIGAAVTLTVRWGEFMPPHSTSFCINSYVFGKQASKHYYLLTQVGLWQLLISWCRPAAWVPPE